MQIIGIFTTTAEEPPKLTTPYQISTIDARRSLTPAKRSIKISKIESLDSSKPKKKDDSKQQSQMLGGHAFTEKINKCLTPIMSLKTEILDELVTNITPARDNSNLDDLVWRREKSHVIYPTKKKSKNKKKKVDQSQLIKSEPEPDTVFKPPLDLSFS